MAHKIYRILPMAEAEAVLDKCEEQKLDWDIWDPEDFLFGNSNKMELGLTEENWKKLGMEEKTRRARRIHCE